METSRTTARKSEAESLHLLPGAAGRCDSAVAVAHDASAGCPISVEESEPWIMEAADWTKMPEVEFKELPSGSCLIGDALCYHPDDPIEFSKFNSKKFYDMAAKEDARAVHFFGMAKGFIQAQLGMDLPDPVSKVLWDPHPNLTEQILGPNEREAIWKRWKVVHTVKEYTDIIKAEGGIKRLPICHPGMNEVMHWNLGFMDWANRNRAKFRDMKPLAQYPSQRSIQRIGLFGTVPGLQQMNRIGDRDAIVISQGPGLKDCFEAIRLAAQRGAVLYAAVQACKTLNEAGIIPHFVVSADPSETMAKLAVGCKFGAAIIESMAHPGFYAPEFRGRLLHFQIMSSHTHQAAADILGWPAFDDSFATVTEIMVQIARQAMGAKRVFMFGCDFGATPETEHNPWPSYLSSFRVPTYGGKWAWTNAHYNHARHWVEEIAIVAEKGEIYRYSVGLPVLGEHRMEKPEDMLEVLHKHKPYDFTLPKPRECDILSKVAILEYLRHKGLDMDNATNPEHKEDFRYAFSPLAHELKVQVVDHTIKAIMDDDPYRQFDLTNVHPGLSKPSVVRVADRPGGLATAFLVNGYNYPSMIGNSMVDKNDPDYERYMRSHPELTGKPAADPITPPDEMYQSPMPTSAEIGNT